MMNGLSLLLAVTGLLAGATGDWPVAVILVGLILVCEAAYRPLPPKGFVRDAEGNLIVDGRERDS